MILSPARGWGRIITERKRRTNRKRLLTVAMGLHDRLTPLIPALHSSVDIKEAIRKLSGSNRKKALVLKERIEALQNELENLLTALSPLPVKRIVQRHKKLKGAARKKISTTMKAGLSRISGKKPEEIKIP